MATAESTRAPAPPAASSAPRRMSALVVVTVALALLVLSVIHIASQIQGALVHGDDFRQYWNGASSVVAGRSPYEWLDLKSSQDNQDYVYPPLIALLFAPAVLALDYATARWAWLVFSVLCLAAGLVLIWRGTGVRLAGPWALAPLGLAVLWPSITWALTTGQVSPQLLLLVVAIFIAVTTARPATAGVLVALGAWIKLFPGLLGGYLLLRRQWRAAAIAVAVGLALAVLSVLALGWEPHWTYLTRAMPAYRRWIAADYNQSLAGFFTRLFVANDFSAPVVDSYPLTQVAIALSSLLVLAVSAYAVWRAPAHRDGAAAAFSVTVLASLLVSPMTGHYLLMLAALPLAVAIARVHAAWPRHLAWLLFAMILLALPWEYCDLEFARDWCHTQFAVVPDDLPWRRGWGNVFIAGPMFGMLTLWALLVRLCLQPSSSPRQPPGTHPEPIHP